MSADKYYKVDTVLIGERNIRSLIFQIRTTPAPNQNVRTFPMIIENKVSLNGIGWLVLKTRQGCLLIFSRMFEAVQKLLCKIDRLVRLFYPNYKYLPIYKHMTRV